MRRLALLVLVLIALAGGTTACSDKTNGSAVPPGQTTTEQTTGSTPPKQTTSSKPASASDLRGKDPCTLLTSAGQAQLGITGGEKSNLGGARGCRWTLRGSDENTVFGVYIYDSLGIKDLPNDGGSSQLPKVGSHEAVQRLDPQNPGACSVVIGVTDSSRVTALAVKGTDAKKGCDLAMQLAKLVEPELPRG